MEQPTKLLNRNFFLLWQGQSISRLGSQGFIIAMLFWIKHTTDSATLMGLLQMFSAIPAVMLGPVAGVLADRYPRRSIIILSDVVRGLAVLLLAGLIFLASDKTDFILVALFLVAVLNATVSAFFEPAITASIPDIVPKEQVFSANSMGRVTSQLAIFVGQGLGGILFRLLGAPMLFIINGLTYLFAAGSETFVHIPQEIPKKSSGLKERLAEFKTDIGEGMRYVWNRKGLRRLVMVSAYLAFFTAPVIILLPFFVEDFLQVSIDWYGFIVAAYGIGTMGGFLFAGVMKFSGKKRGGLMLIFILGEAAGYGMLGLMRDPILALGLAFVGGFTGGFVAVNITTILQISTPREIRGRVFGLLGAITAGLTPVSMGLAGVVADLLNQNIPLLYGTCGGIMAVLSLIVAFNQDFRDFLAYEEPDQPEILQPQVVILE